MLRIVLLLAVGVAALGCDSETNPMAHDEDYGEVHVDSQQVHIRVNVVGYLEEDSKVAIAFSHSPLNGSFEVRRAESGDVVLAGNPRPSAADGWGTFDYY